MLSGAFRMFSYLCCSQCCSGAKIISIKKTLFERGPLHNHTAILDMKLTIISAIESRVHRYTSSMSNKPLVPFQIFNYFQNCNHN